MNKPAAKEPSMDEILSSIRQIIADDDEGAPPRRPSLQVAPDPMEPTPVSANLDDGEDGEALALSSEQIVPEGEAAADMGFEALLADTQNEAPKSQDAPSLVVPDDVGFASAEAEVAELPSFDPVPRAAEASLPEFSPEPRNESAPVLSSFDYNESRAPAEPAPEPASFSRPSVASASPMPDSKLSADIANSLLESTTQAAVRSSIGKLNAAGIGVVTSPSLGNGNITIEAIVREMLRPMLKEWLDENLPAVVERMVEKEIARVARGE